MGVFTQSWPFAVGSVVVLFLLAYALGYRKALSLLSLGILTIVSIALVTVITLFLASFLYDKAQASQFLFFGTRMLTLRHQIIAGTFIGAVTSLIGFVVFTSSDKEGDSFETYFYGGAVLGIIGGAIVWVIVTLLGSLFDWGFGFGFGLLFNLLCGFLVTAIAGMGAASLVYVFVKSRRP